MSAPRLLDLFCGAGGCSEGYRRAGFEVVGVDSREQPRYRGGRFVCADALEYLEEHWWEYDVIHASPPCQAFSVCRYLRPGVEYVDLLTPTVEALRGYGDRLLWVVENVPGSPISDSVCLCGLMFGLGVFRHRHFLSNAYLMCPPHPSHRGLRLGDGRMFCVAGNGGRFKTWGRDLKRGRMVDWSRAMGIDWMVKRELTQAIPPAYTEYLGVQLYRMVVSRGTRGKGRNDA